MKVRKFRSVLASAAVVLGSALMIAPPAMAGNGNGNNGNHFGQAPEIDGANIVLALALVGGVVSLLKKRK